ncbi:metallophosphoesterase family protein [Thalassospira xiamenensis]|uniref:Predicted phosphoesterase n=1 Tax=Thalassospira xiamenensis TaxID=220697 RepID=A0A285TV79_9PROT|nr:metallophosphoesterase [Thalassospira xiamenensis]SOC27447.1 Predicted phosphoesterase [Thalassospira xiamenensis]
MTILFYGDPHKKFSHLKDAVAKQKPEHVVILGDLELERSIREELASFFESGIGVWYILGNHDTTTGEQLDWLLEDYPEGNLGTRTVTISSDGTKLTLGGLGGVYRGKVWFPRSEEPPKFHTRAEYLEKLAHHARWRKGLPLRQRDTIFPEDHQILSAMRCDILVTHEAPSSHVNGTVELDQLAADMHARLLVHGHMHDSYVGMTSTGIPVRGLDGCELLSVNAAEFQKVASCSNAST